MKTPFELMLDSVDFVEVEATDISGDVPYVTHEGNLKFGHLEILVYQLNTGQRIIPMDEMDRIFAPDLKES